MIKRQTITSQAINYILDLIKQGHVKPGERLPTEKELTETLSVSRTCVREAVKSLESLRLITVRPRVGAVVLEPSPDSLFNARQLGASVFLQSPDALIEFRRVLEVGLAGLAAEKRTDSDLAAMRMALDQHARAIATDRIIHNADVAFHKAVAEATKNPLAIMVMQTISQALIERSREVNKVPHVPEEGLAEHRRIYRAIYDRNPDRARRVMLHHIETQERNIRALATVRQRRRTNARLSTAPN